MCLEGKALSNKSTRYESLLRLPKSSAIKAVSLEQKSSSNTKWLSYDPKELCDRLTIIIQGKQAGKIFTKIGEEFIAMADKILEYKCVSTK